MHRAGTRVPRLDVRHRGFSFLPKSPLSSELEFDSWKNEQTQAFFFFFALLFFKKYLKLEMMPGNEASLY